MLLQLQERIEDIAALGAKPLGISIAAEYQAQHLMDNEVEFELLLDPESNFKTEALNMKRLRLWDLVSPIAVKRYLKWFGKTRQGVPTSPLSEPPAMAIIGSDGVVRYVYEGETLGDYPSIDVVLEELEKMGTS